jgi:hypothetical protein
MGNQPEVEIPLNAVALFGRFEMRDSKRAMRALRRATRVERRELRDAGCETKAGGRAIGSRSVSIGRIVVVGSTGLDDIEREATLQFHAGRTKDGTEGARGATLLSDDFADVAWGDVEAKYGCVLVGKDFHPNRIGIIDEGPGNFRHESLHFRDSETAVGDRVGIRHTYTSRE